MGTIERSCVMNRYDTPDSSCSFLSNLSTWDRTETSNAEVGSSQIISSGSTASALAMPIRCRCPPENSCG